MGNIKPKKKSAEDIKMTQNYNKNIVSGNDMKLKNYKYFINESEVFANFKMHAIEGKYLNFNKFNDCISSLLKFNIPLVSYTYLSEKLFSLMEKVKF